MYTGILPAASNRADLVFQVQLFNTEALPTLELGDPVPPSPTPPPDPIDLKNSVITVALRPLNMSVPALTGTNLDGHITILTLNTFYVRFTRDEMIRFPAGEIDMGITLKLPDDGITRQIFKGQVPVIDGVVLP